MNYLLNKYCPRIDFESYEDFFENFDIDVPENFNFAHDVVDQWAKHDPYKKALIWCNDAGEEKALTFAEISEMSNRFAHALVARGVKKGSVVLLILRRRWEYYIAANALWKIGAVLIPGSIQLTTKDIDYRVKSSGAEMIIAVDDEYVITQAQGAAANLPQIHSLVSVGSKREGWEFFDDLIDEGSSQWERAEEFATTNEDPMMIYFTSGTTGLAKMVRHNHPHPLGHIITAKFWQQVQEDKLHLSVSDSGWAKFGWGKIFGQWICGAVVFVYDMDAFDPKKLLETVEKYQITTFCAPPTMYRFMLQEDVASYDLSSVANFATAGEPLNADVNNRWIAATDKPIREGFGQTETVVIIATWPWIEPRPGSLGKPAPLYNVKLLGESGVEAELGEEGAICVTELDKTYPPGLFVGYYRDDERTKEALGGDIYNLGDMAWKDSDGYLSFVGRNDDVIKASGYRIGPFEVESALIEHPAVIECAVTGFPDELRGVVVKATIVLASGYEASEELVKELQKHVRDTTAPYKYPRIIEFVEELPKTIGGKIKRAEIRAADATHEAETAD